MLTSDQILQTINFLVIPEPKSSKEAEISSAQKWARDEIKYRLADNPFDDPEDILFWFMEEMFVYSTMPCVIKKEINPFLEAKNYVETILAMLECPTEE